MKKYDADGEYIVKWKDGQREGAMLNVRCDAVESICDDVQKMKEALFRVYHVLQFYAHVDEKPEETIRGHWINYVQELSPRCLRWMTIKEIKTA